MTTKKPRAMRVRIRKYNGDDAYSWAVFVDGQVVRDLTGLNRHQARYYRDMIKKEQAK